MLFGFSFAKTKPQDKELNTITTTTNFVFSFIKSKPYGCLKVKMKKTGTTDTSKKAINMAITNIRAFFRKNSIFFLFYHLFFFVISLNAYSSSRSFVALSKSSNNAAFFICVSIFFKTFGKSFRSSFS